MLRFYLQAIQRELLIAAARNKGDENPPRTALCLRAPINKDRGVEFWQKADSVRVRYGNLQTCRKLWTCAVCAARISEGRRVELSEVISLYGGSLTHTALTLSHSQGDDLADLLDVLRNAYRRFKSGRWYQGLKSIFQVEAVITALEVTHGDHGWHPHLHVLIFHAGKTIARDAETFVMFEHHVRSHWAEVVEKEGGIATYEAGADVRRADDGAAGYMAKIDAEGEALAEGWTAAHELTKAHSKRGREGGRTPYQLLLDYADQDDQQAGALWLEYTNAMQGRNHLTGLPAARRLVGLDDISKTDDELAGDIDDLDRLLGGIALYQWRELLSRIGSRSLVPAELLDAWEREGADGARRVLSEHGITLIGVWSGQGDRHE